MAAATVVAAVLAAVFATTLAALKTTVTTTAKTAVLSADRPIGQCVNRLITAAARAPIARSTTRPISCSAGVPHGGGDSSSGGFSGRMTTVLAALKTAVTAAAITAVLPAERLIGQAANRPITAALPNCGGGNSGRYFRSIAPSDNRPTGR